MAVTPRGPNGGLMSDDALLIAMGVYEGIREYSKFGTNLATGTSYVPVWVANQAWTRMAAASTLEVASSSTADAAAGNGATLLMVQGLDANYDEIEEVVVLTGQTPVVTTAIFLCVNRAFIVGSTGSINTNAGDIYVSDDSTAWTAGVPNTLASIQAKILIGAGFTQQAIYTVPAGHTVYISDLYVSGASNKEVSFQLRAIDNVNNVDRVSMEGTLLNDTAIRLFNPYVAVPEKYTIYAQTKVGATTGLTSAGFNMMIVANDRSNP